MLEASLQPKRLLGKRVLLTAGPTFERIDAVRGITNSSSGKMGYAIARAAYEAGAEVVLVSGETALPTPMGTRRINVLSAQQMLNAVEAEVAAADIFIAVAAVADYYVLNPSEQKIKKRRAYFNARARAQSGYFGQYYRQRKSTVLCGFCR
nr:phosphopantothenoylcysteine decarboxylase [Deefgea sp. CFH1-16]